MKKFILMTRGRTGSTAILDELSSCNGVYVFPEQEIFAVQELSGDETETFPAFYQVWRKLQKNGDNGLDNFLSAYEKHVAEEGKVAAGFKVLSHNFEQWPGLVESLKKREYVVVYLTRNIPRQVLSGLVAHQRGVYNSKNYTDDASYEIDVEELKSRASWEFKQVELDKELLESKMFETLFIDYQEYIDDREALIRKLLNFLELDSSVPPKTSYSVMIQDITKTIKNYKEVDECMRNLDSSVQ